MAQSHLMGYFLSLFSTHEKFDFSNPSSKTTINIEHIMFKIFKLLYLPSLVFFFLCFVLLSIEYKHTSGHFSISKGNDQITESLR